jgi:hypothetical protein
MSSPPKTSRIPRPTGHDSTTTATDPNTEWRTRYREGRDKPSEVISRTPSRFRMRNLDSLSNERIGSLQDGFARNNGLPQGTMSNRSSTRPQLAGNIDQKSQPGKRPLNNADICEPITAQQVGTPWETICGKSAEDDGITSDTTPVNDRSNTMDSEIFGGCDESQEDLYASDYETPPSSPPYISGETESGRRLQWIRQQARDIDTDNHIQQHSEPSTNHGHTAQERISDGRGPHELGRRSSSGADNAISVNRQPSTWPQISSRYCRSCEQGIVGKSISSADGRLTGRYHKSCFVCAECSQPFKTNEFYVINDRPFCEHDYHSLNGSLCGNCQLGIEGRYLEDEDLVKYHYRGCFCCDDCGRDLVDGYFELGADKKVFCEYDATRRISDAGANSHVESLATSNAAGRSDLTWSTTIDPEIRENHDVVRNQQHAGGREDDRWTKKGGVDDDADRKAQKVTTANKMRKGSDQSRNESGLRSYFKTPNRAPTVPENYAAIGAQDTEGTISSRLSPGRLLKRSYTEKSTATSRTKIGPSQTTGFKPTLSQLGSLSSKGAPQVERIKQKGKWLLPPPPLPPPNINLQSKPHRDRSIVLQKRMTNIGMFING